jgi:hypothetical protein
MPGLGGPAARAMDELAATLMERCHRRDEAIALMASELDRLGVGNWSIRTDGPLAVPVGQQDAVREHIAAGCYVYSGNQASKSGDGGRVFFLAGP